MVQNNFTCHSFSEYHAIKYPSPKQKKIREGKILQDNRQAGSWEQKEGSYEATHNICSSFKII